MKTTRRTFLHGGATFAGAAALAAAGTAGRLSTDEARPTENLPPTVPPAEVEAILFQTPPTTRRGDMLYRKLGRTNEEVSLIGLGGHHIGTQKDEQESIRIIRTAIDRGVTFLDNSWDYNEGRSETRMGKALKDGYRGKVFLMTKFDGRTKKSAAEQIDESLKRLQVDHVDLIQFHENIRMEDPDRFFSEGGALDAVVEAKKAGKVRYIGFTGHKDPMVHLRMLEMAKLHDFHFDTCQMPVNVMDANFRSFQRQVLPVLVREGVAPLAMKCFGGGAIAQDVLKSGAASPIDLLHFTMTRPVSVVITGMNKMQILEQALEAVKTFKPMTPEQAAALLEKTRPTALTGKLEKFKTTQVFDATAQNPKWLG